MAELRSGSIRASGYAKKMWKVAFAAMKKKVPDDVIKQAVAELNKRLFEDFKNHNIQKNYIVRIVAPYKIRDGQIVWDYDNLEYEAYIPVLKVKGGEVVLVQPSEKEQFESTFEEYSVASEKEETKED